MRVLYRIFKSPIGEITLIANDKSLLRVIFPGAVLPSDIGEPSLHSPILDLVCIQLEEYFAGQRRTFTFNYDLGYATEFQRKVYDSLKKIPYGEIRAYQDIAISIGNNNASRAVGLANKKNPLPIVIPCHRVMGKGNISRGL